MTSTAERLVHDLRRADPRLVERTRDLAERWLIGAPLPLAKRTEVSTKAVPDVSSARVEQSGFDLLEALDQTA